MKQAPELLEALSRGDLPGAAAVLQPWLDRHGPEALQQWQHWLAPLVEARLQPLLVPLLQQRAVSHGDPHAEAVANALRLTLSQAAVDRVITTPGGQYLIVGWQQSWSQPWVVVLTGSGHWLACHGTAPPLRRPDVSQHLGLPTCGDAGLLVRVPVAAGDTIARLWLQGQEAAPTVLDACDCPYPLLVDTLLQACQLEHTPIERLPELLHHALAPVLLRACEPLRPTALWPSLIERRLQLGQRHPDAAVTVVVPLYGRWDVVLGQIASFQIDPAFSRGLARLLYVVDDPSIASAFGRWCSAQWAESALDITVVMVDQNRGFGMACNIGVATASSEKVLLLNSDVFALQPGWLERLLAHHASTPDALLAPLLVDDEGLIQHAGMRAEARLDNPALPACIHPGKGQQAALWPQLAAPSSVEALSGAALLFQRQRWLALGGFEPVFGTGDFEDLELSLRWRRAGLPLLLASDVRLLHLEGQSLARQGLLAQWRTAANAWWARKLCPELQVLP